MSEPRTLTEAREQLETLSASSQAIATRLAAYESNESLAAAGIVRVDDEKGVHFSVPRIPELETQISELGGKITALESEKAALFQTLDEHCANLSGARTRIAELEATAKTAEAKAREITGNLGGPPLAVDSSQSLTSLEELETALIAEKDPMKRGEIFKRLDAMKKSGAQK